MARWDYAKDSAPSLLFDTSQCTDIRQCTQHCCVKWQECPRQRWVFPAKKSWLCGCHVVLQKRLQKELMSLMKEPPPGVTVNADLAEQNLLQWVLHVWALVMGCVGLFACSWIINMEGVPGTLYEGEQFQLQFKFSNKYPFDSPEVRKTSHEELCL